MFVRIWITPMGNWRRKTTLAAPLSTNRSTLDPLKFAYIQFILPPAPNSTFLESNHHLHVLFEEASVQHLDMCRVNSSLLCSNTCTCVLWFMHRHCGSSNKRTHPLRSTKCWLWRWFHVFSFSYKLGQNETKSIKTIYVQTLSWPICQERSRMRNPHKTSLLQLCCSAALAKSASARSDRKSCSAFTPWA